jgi:uncharacterized RDD family membrane protein YckC
VIQTAKLGKERDRRVMTPEGIELVFRVASPSDRVTAFLTDIMVLLVSGFIFILIASYLISFLGGGREVQQAFHTFSVLLFFFLRNFYFILLEMRWGGATVGKRVVGIRVISRDGGPVGADAIVVRNLMRELEFFLPIGVLLRGAHVMGMTGEWSWLIEVAWLVVFLVFPLLGRNRLRCGDLVAGTIVVRMPRAQLLPDLAQTKKRTRMEIEGRRAERKKSRYAFTQEQLDIYGIRELQVLEDLLRRKDQLADPAVLEAVCIKIRRKIGWPQADQVETLVFLDEFYQAQRGRLEQRMLFGDRRERKKR